MGYDPTAQRHTISGGCVTLVETAEDLAAVLGHGLLSNVRTLSFQVPVLSARRVVIPAKLQARDRLGPLLAGAKQMPDKLIHLTTDRYTVIESSAGGISGHE